MPEVSCPRGRGSGEARTIAHEGADLGIVLSALARLRTPAVMSAPAVSRGTMSAGADSQLAGWSPQHGWTLVIASQACRAARRLRRRGVLTWNGGRVAGSRSARARDDACGVRGDGASRSVDVPRRDVDRHIESRALAWMRPRQSFARARVRALATLRPATWMDRGCGCSRGAIRVGPMSEGAVPRAVRLGSTRQGAAWTARRWARSERRGSRADCERSGPAGGHACGAVLYGLKR